jgi:hypothetical protein
MTQNDVDPSVSQARPVGYPFHVGQVVSRNDQAILGVQPKSGGMPGMHHGRLAANDGIGKIDIVGDLRFPLVIRSAYGRASMEIKAPDGEVIFLERRHYGW